MCSNVATSQDALDCRDPIFTEAIAESHNLERLSSRVRDSTREATYRKQEDLAIAYD